MFVYLNNEKNNGYYIKEMQEYLKIFFAFMFHKTPTTKPFWNKLKNKIFISYASEERWEEEINDCNEKCFSISNIGIDWKKDYFDFTINLITHETIHLVLDYIDECLSSKQLDNID